MMLINLILLSYYLGTDELTAESFYLSIFTNIFHTQMQIKLIPNAKRWESQWFFVWVSLSFSILRSFYLRYVFSSLIHILMLEISAADSIRTVRFGFRNFFRYHWYTFWCIFKWNPFRTIRHRWRISWLKSFSFHLRKAKKTTKKNKNIMFVNDSIAFDQSNQPFTNKRNEQMEKTIERLKCFMSIS